jgi:hypothetical protein
MLRNLQRSTLNGRQSVRAPPHLVLCHFGNFEEPRTHQEVFEQKTFDAYSLEQLFTSVLEKSRVYPLLA